MKIVAEVGSPEYYELRAIEEVHAARSIRQGIPPKRLSAHAAEYQQHITKSIQLLVLAGITSGTSQDD